MLKKKMIELILVLLRIGYSSSFSQEVTESLQDSLLIAPDLGSDTSIEIQRSDRFELSLASKESEESAEIILNPIKEAGSDLLAQIQPSVAGMTNGQFVIVWNTLGTKKFCLKIFNSNEEPSDSEMTLNLAQFPMNFSVIGLPQEILIIYSIQNDDFRKQDHGLLYDYKRTVTRSLFTASSNSLHSTAKVSKLSSGKLVIVRHDANGDLITYVYDSENYELESIADAIQSPNIGTFCICALEDDSFIVIWTDDTKAKAKLFDGSHLQKEISILLEEDTSFKRISAKAFTNADFLVVWETDLEIKRQMFDKEGMKRGSVIVMDSSGVAKDFSIAVNQYDRVVIVWSEAQNNKNKIIGKIYDKNQDFLAKEFAIDENIPDEIAYVQVSSLSDGSFVVTWAKDLGNTSKIFFRTVQELSVESSHRYIRTECHEICETCDGSTENDCLSCQDAYILENRTCNCPQGFALSNTLECIECPANCEICTYSESSSTTHCSSCASGYYKKEEACTECPSSCNNCYYSEEDDAAKCHSCMDSFTYLKNGECFECPSSCNSCYYSEEDDAAKCHSCADSFTYLKNGECFECPSSCENCYYSEEDDAAKCHSCTDSFTYLKNGECFECPSSCENCYYSEEDDAAKCHSCADSFTYLKNGECFECPSSCDSCYYSEEDDDAKCHSCTDSFTYLKNGECFECPSSCDSCYYSEEDDVAKCYSCSESDTYDIDGECFECPSTCNGCYYSEEDDAVKCYSCNESDAYDIDGECFECPSTCNGCYHSEEDDAVKCYSCSVDETYMIDGICFNCPESCDSCYYSESDESVKCYSCSSNLYYIKDEVCLKCPDSCTDCYYSTETDSLSCNSCAIGYYLKDDVCLSCAESCEECYYNEEDDSVECTSCKNTHYLKENLCLACPDLCEECDYSTGNDSISCSLCESGYYLKEGTCLSCPDLCEECNYSEEHNSVNCTSCKNANNYVKDGNCYECPDSCQECAYSQEDDSIACGSCINDNYHFQEGNCFLCPEDCKDCEVSENGSGACKSCLKGYYLQDGHCLKCSDDCEDCASPENCLVCNEMYVNINGVCTCPQFYTFSSGKCELNLLELDLSLSSGTLFLKFSEDLDKALSQSNIVSSYFEPSKYKANMIIISRSNSQYELYMSSIPKKSASLILMLSGIAGESGSVLETETFVVELTGDDNEIKEDTEEILEGISGEDAALYASSISFSISLGLAVITLQPNIIWSLINFSMMIYFIPLQNTGMPRSLQDFCQGIGSSERIPSLSDVLDIEKEDCFLPPEHWVEYGIESTCFLVNSGQILFLFFLSLLALPLFLIVYIVSCNEKLKRFAKNRISDFQWSFFLRFWIQVYLDFMIFSVLSAGTLFSDKVILDNAFSCFIFLLGNVTMLGVFLFTYLRRQSISQGDIKKYESLYEEFRVNEGIWCFIFYSLFLIRRLIMAYGIYFLVEDPIFQVILNAICSLVTVVYLLVCKPFKVQFVQNINVLYESVLLILICLSGVFIFDLSDDNRRLMAQVFVFSVYLTIFITLVFFLVKFVGLIRKYFKNRNRCRTVRPETIDEEYSEKKLKQSSNTVSSERIIT